MNGREVMKAKRINLINSYFRENITALSADAPGLTAFANELKAKNIELFRLQGITLPINISGTEQTDYERAKMEEQALKMSGSMRAYFLSTDNSLNADLAHLTIGMLHNSSQAKAVYECEALLKMAQEFSVQIEPFGVTAGMLTDFHTDIEKFRSTVLETKIERKERVAAGKKIAETLTECDQLLKIISGIMIALKSRHQSLYTLFKIKMKIGKAHGRRKKPNFEEEIEAGEVVLIADLPYDAKRTVKIKNKSGVDLKWGISESETEFTSPPHTLKAKATSRKLSATLAESGIFLIIENLSDKTAAIQVWLVGGTKQKDAKTEDGGGDLGSDT